MLRIGCHLSSAKGYLNMAKEAVSIDGNSFQFFTRNPRGGKAKVVDLDDIAAYKAFAKEHDVANILAHAPYTLNPCSAKPEVRDFAKIVFTEDLELLSNFDNALYNFHPGSHVSQGVEPGIEMIAALLNEVLTESQTTTVLLETMAGKGTEIGRSFEELAEILGKVKHVDKMGVCLDTCHVFDAGYDIVENLDGVLSDFDRIIGFSYLKAIHLNDSKNLRGSHKDRHAAIGEGEIGKQALVSVVTHPKLLGLPFLLETPHDTLAGYGAEIAMLRAEFQENTDS